jgi:hypothetical protein
MHTAPILLFVYNRLDSLKQTVRALQQNKLSAESELFIFSDNARRETDITAVTEVRQYIRTVNGFRKVHIREAAQNLGLARSVIGGVTEIVDRNGKVIVLEDDLVTSSNFLSFMNQALDHYCDNKRIFSIGGYTKPMKGLGQQDVYFTQRASSWGWATWKDRWSGVDWEAHDYHNFSKDPQARKRFNSMGSDMSRMLDRQMQGIINSWAILWCYHQFKTGQLTVFPAISKVRNEGFSAEATHTREKRSRFKTVLDRSGEEKFHFTDHVELDRKIIRQFAWTYSIPMRIAYKIINMAPF